MGQSSNTLHESAETIGEAVIDRHRAIVSLMEELEAIDWYDQRAAATSDEALRDVLAHNRDEEKEHAMMTLEWLRRHDAVLDGHMRAYLFKEGSIAGREAEVESEGRGPTQVARAGDQAEGSLGIGSLRGHADGGELP
jgi:ferritin-like protein